MPTIEERALALVYEVRKERGLTPWYEGRGSREDSSLLEAFCRTLEAHDATLAEFEEFKREVSDSVEHYLDQWRNSTPSREVFACQFGSFILPKPVDPLVYLAREMVLLDGVVRTDSQKAAIREGRAANTAADDFYDRLRTALPARGLKLVEVGDAD